jgi:hypothetical protein
VSISADENNTLYETGNYSSYYFHNLKENYGRNVKGSCTYVAFGMLLSFWDTYWNDSFIPENYDMITLCGNDDEVSYSLDSPGIYQETTSLVNGETTQEYYNTIEKYSNYYLHLKLIQLGKEELGQYVFDTSESPCGLYYSQLQDLANYYLYTYLGLSSSVVKIKTNNSENMNTRDFTISMIKEGYPVELRMGKKDSSGNVTSGHAMVAYDYNQSTDTIYVHPGWAGFPTHVSLNSIGYNDFWDATALIPQTSHSCSNNFKFSNGFAIHTHCACEFPSHPNYRAHVFGYRYEYAGDNCPNYHKIYCACGAWKFERHSYSNMYQGTDGHIYAYCHLCQRTVLWK